MEGEGSLPYYKIPQLDPIPYQSNAVDIPTTHIFWIPCARQRMNYMKIVIILCPNFTAHLQHRYFIIFLSSATCSSRPTTVTPVESVSRDNSLYGEQ